MYPLYLLVLTTYERIIISSVVNEIQTIFFGFVFQSEDYNTMLGFKMRSHKHAKAVWKTCVEYHSFFRLNRKAISKSTSKQSKSYFTACMDTTQSTKDHEEPSRKQFTKLAKISQTIAENRMNEK